MPKKSQNVYYAVYRGRRTGVFRSWDACRAQVDNYGGARFRRFTGPHCRKMAEAFVRTGKVEKEEEETPSPANTTSPMAQDLARYIPTDHWRCKRAEMSGEEPLTVYTDGSTAGYGVWFGPNDRRNFKEHFTLPNPTNNRSELMGVIRALEMINERNYAPDDTQGRVRERLICTDSKYVIGCVTNWYATWQRTGWRGNTVKNRALIERLVALCRLHPVSFFWTPGHQGIAGNEGADKLAGEANREEAASTPSATTWQKPSEVPFAFQ